MHPDTLTGVIVMVRADVITLIGEVPDAHGVFDETTQVERDVMCTVRSASFRDIQASGSDGLRPELVFRLAQDFEYQGERVCRYKGLMYNIDRTYFSETEDWIDLTCSRGEP